MDLKPEIKMFSVLYMRKLNQEFLMHSTTYPLTPKQLKQLVDN